MQRVPEPGDFVRVRSRRWLVEHGRSFDGLNTVSLACIDDDAQGEAVSVLWDAELDAEPTRDGSTSRRSVPMIRAFSPPICARVRIRTVFRSAPSQAV